jgi:hypothetical protein
MNTIDFQRGKNLNASFSWVDFVTSNPDIMSVLSTSPLRVKRIGKEKFAAWIFTKHLQLKFEIIQHESKEGKGTSRTLADIQLPFGLGRTHTVSQYTYFAIDDHTTSLDLNLSIELSTFAMRRVAAFLRDRIESYLNRLCGDIETATILLEKDDPKLGTILDEDQKQRVTDWRDRLTKASAKSSLSTPTMHGALTLRQFGDKTLVAVEAEGVNGRLLSAEEQINTDDQMKASVFAQAKLLASINNPVFGTVRGSALAGIDKEFRQEALEFGSSLYRSVCQGRVREVLPVLLSRGSSSRISLVLSGQHEGIPWEAMYDGGNFLCLTVRLSRVVTLVGDEARALDLTHDSGILLVGADSRGDLAGVDLETQTIAEMLSARGMKNVKVLNSNHADRATVLKELKSGKFKMFHFSGHSVFDEKYPFQSYLELCGGMKIYLNDIAQLDANGPRSARLALAFLNSCESARLGSDQVTGRQLSLCRFMRESGAAACVVGMLWNVGDEAATQVGTEFYNTLVGDVNFDPVEAMRRTRRSVATKREWKDGSWLAPVVYS